MHHTRLARVVLPIIAVAAALIVVGSGGASTTHLAAKADAACAGPSVIDIAHSDPFWYWPCASFLHVEIGPTDASMGFVRSDPYYIDCPSACTRPYEPGAKTTLWATPSHGTEFTGWSGAACEGQGNPCIATVVGDETVTANFSGTVTPIVPAASGPQMVTLHIFMGDTFSQQNASISVAGPSSFGCTQAQMNCSHDYPLGTHLGVWNAGCPTTWTDSSAPGGLFGNPYFFTMTSNRTVNPHVVCPV
jgi:hypothetical protein